MTRMIEAQTLVPGDIVLLESDDKVPADLRLIEVKNLRTEEAALTGESVPADKMTDAVAAEATVGDRESMAFSGTMVVSGRATGVVVATGCHTELGRINAMLASVNALETPLILQIKSLGHRIAGATGLIALLLYVFARWVRGMEMVDVFQAVTGIAVSVIPDSVLQLIGRVAMLCNDPEIHQQDGAWKVEGDPTEGALYPFASKLGMECEAERTAHPRIDSIPFESEHRFMAKLIVRVVGQGRPPGEESREVAPELNPLLLEVPPMAVDAARRELLQLGARVGALLDAAGPAIRGGRDAEIDALHAGEQLIDQHHAAILAFLEQVLQADRAPDISRSAIDLIEAADYLEAISDLVDREIIPLFQRHAERGTTTDARSRERLRTLAEAVRREFRRAVQAVGDEDQALAASVIGAKSQMRGLERAVIDVQIDTDASDEPGPLRPSALDRELAELLRRIYSLIRRFVQVGTGLHRAGRDNAGARDAEWTGR